MNTPTLRAATPADVDAVQAFVRALSIESRTRRFFAPVRELSPALVQALVGRDPRHHFVVMLDGSRVIGLGQYARLASCADSADFALVVADDWQGWGLGRRILEALRTTGGGTAAVTETEIREAVRTLGRAGFCVEPTSAVVLPALDRLTTAGRLRPAERVVLVLSGFGLKAGALLQDLAG